jgi:hypothetical protein
MVDFRRFVANPTLLLYAWTTSLVLGLPHDREEKEKEKLYVLGGFEPPPSC